MEVKKSINKLVIIKKKESFYQLLKKNKIFLFMVLPTMLYFLIFNYAPMVGIILAFKKFNYTKGIFGSEWVGFNNFKILLDSGKLLLLTKNNIMFNLVFLFVGVVVNIFTAIVISEISGKIFKKIGQSATLFPFFISWVVVNAVFFNIFNFDYGVLNNLLNSLGIQPFDIYSNKGAWPYIMVFLNNWKYFGYGTILYLAAIAAIDTSIYESAYIDGANIFKRIRLITLPMLVPTIMISLLLQVGGMMKANFDMFYQMVGNNPYVGDQLQIIETFVFNAITQGGTSSDIGIATAVGLYQSIFGLVLITITNKLVKKYSSENALF